MKNSKKQNSAGARLHFGVLVHVRERRHVSSWLFALAGRACRTWPQQCNFKRWRKQTTAGVECARNQSWANLGTNCGADTESVSSSRPAINQAANLPTCLSQCFKPIAASLALLSAKLAPAWRAAQPSHSISPTGQAPLSRPPTPPSSLLHITWLGPLFFQAGRGGTRIREILLSSFAATRRVRAGTSWSSCLSCRAAIAH